MRRLLADTAATHAISAEDAQVLRALGAEPAPVGLALEPPIELFCVPRDALARLARAEPIPVRLGCELLQARCVALVPFEPELGPPDEPGGEHR